MTKSLEDTVEEISDEIHKEWDIGRVFYGMYRALTLEIIKRLEVRKWHRIPKLPEEGRYIQFLYREASKWDKYGEAGTFENGDEWVVNQTRLVRTDKVYAWRYLDEGLPAEATGETITSKDPEGKETTITLYVSNLIRTTTANTLINIMSGLKISAYYSKEEAESNQIRGHNDALNTAIAKINSYIDQHQPPSDKAELDPDISRLLKLAEGDRFGRLDYYPRDWTIPKATKGG